MIAIKEEEYQDSADEVGDQNFVLVGPVGKTPCTDY